MHINNKYYMLNIYCKSGLNRFWLSFFTALEFLPWKFNWHVLLLEFFGLKWWNKIKLMDRHFHTGVYKFLRNISANIWSLQKSTRLKLRTLSLIFQIITIPVVSGCLPFVRINRLGRSLNNGKSFSKISKPTERNGAYHLHFNFP